MTDLDKKIDKLQQLMYDEPYEVERDLFNAPLRYPYNELYLAMSNILPELIAGYKIADATAKTTSAIADAANARAKKAEAEVKRILDEADDEIDMWSIALRTTEKRAAQIQKERDWLASKLSLFSKRLRDFRLCEAGTTKYWLRQAAKRRKIKEYDAQKGAKREEIK